MYNVALFKTDNVILFTIFIVQFPCNVVPRCPGGAVRANSLERDNYKKNEYSYPYPSIEPKR